MGEDERTEHIVYVPPIPSGERWGAMRVVGWQFHRFAPDWFEDALIEARRPSSTDIPTIFGSRRREIVFSSCCAEAYLVEWTLFSALKGNPERLHEYVPKDGKKDGKKLSINELWKQVTRKLHQDGLIGRRPDFGGPHGTEWNRLLAFRSGFVHANASRPNLHSPVRDLPEPSIDELLTLPPGWAVGVVSDRIKLLHKAEGTDCPNWLLPV